MIILYPNYRKPNHWKFNLSLPIKIKFLFKENNWLFNVLPLKIWFLWRFARYVPKFLDLNSLKENKESGLNIFRWKWKLGKLHYNYWIEKLKFLCKLRMMCKERQGHHGRQGSQGLVKARKRRRLRRRARRRSCHHYGCLACLTYERSTEAALN